MRGEIAALRAHSMSLFKINYALITIEVLAFERKFRLKAGIGVLSIAAIYTLEKPFLGTQSDPDEGQDLPYY